MLYKQPALRLELALIGIDPSTPMLHALRYVGPLDLTRLTWYGPAKGVMDQWVKQFIKVANRKPCEVITDPTAFTLRPF